MWLRHTLCWVLSRSPPLAVQPSFGRFFTRVNDAWIRGYEPVKGDRSALSNVVVVSITGGARDYQVCQDYRSLVEVMLVVGSVG